MRFISVPTWFWWQVITVVWWPMVKLVPGGGALWKAVGDAGWGFRDFVGKQRVLLRGTRSSRTGWWFQNIVLCSSLFGEDFLKGLKPPTSEGLKHSVVCLLLVILYGFYHSKTPLNHDVGNMFDILICHFSNHRRIKSKFKKGQGADFKEGACFKQDDDMCIHIYVDDNVLFVGETCWWTLTGFTTSFARFTRFFGETSRDLLSKA